VSIAPQQWPIVTPISSENSAAQIRAQSRGGTLASDANELIRPAVVEP
jgi:hypothetical protein